MNKEKLRAVAERIATHPDEYYQDWWIKNKTNSGGCGTKACIAGHVCLLDGKIPSSAVAFLDGIDDLKASNKGKVVQASKYAQAALDLTDYQALRLFGSVGELGIPRNSLWPEKFAKQYQEARARRDWQGAACAAAARIKHFIETDGKE